MSTITPSPSRLWDREADHVDDDLVVDAGALRTGVAHVDRLLEQLAVDLHQAHAGLLEVDADEAAGGPLHDVDDAAFDFSHSAVFFEPHGDDVAAGRVVRLVHGDEDVGVAALDSLRPFRPDEAEAGRRAAKGADEVVGRVSALDFFRPHFACRFVIFGRFFLNGISFVLWRVVGRRRMVC